MHIYLNYMFDITKSGIHSVSKSGQLGGIRIVSHLHTLYGTHDFALTWKPKPFGQRMDMAFVLSPIQRQYLVESKKFA